MAIATARGDQRSPRPVPTKSSVSEFATINYLMSQVPPAATISAFSFSASSLETPSFKDFGTPSTRSFASFRPRPVTADNLNHGDLVLAKTRQNNGEFRLLCNRLSSSSSAAHHHHCTATRWLNTVNFLQGNPQPALLPTGSNRRSYRQALLSCSSNSVAASADIANTFLFRKHAFR